MQYQTTKTTSLVNMPVQTTPPGNRFVALLQSKKRKKEKENNQTPDDPVVNFKQKWGGVYWAIGIIW